MTGEKSIIYIDPDTGNPVILIVAKGCGLTLEQIGQKDVPKGVAFGYVDADDVPPTLAERVEKYKHGFSIEGFGADYGAGSKNSVVAWTKRGQPVIRPAID